MKLEQKMMNHSEEEKEEDQLYITCPATFCCVSAVHI
jgi:hypothetical protein